jgi:hypothetical protein
MKANFGYEFTLRVWGVLLLVSMMSSWGLSQEIPEKRLTKEELQRPGVAVLVERLKSLRRNAERFGPKHPSSAAVKKQIAELESQLMVLLGAPAVVSPPKSEAGSKQIAPEPRKGLSATDRKQPSRLALESAWGLDPWSQWPPTVEELRRQTDLISGYREAYPWLGIKSFIAAGAMPGMGLLWGICYDRSDDRSYVYQWYDSSRSEQSELYFETSGRLLSIYFPSDFDRTGVFWGVRSSSSLGSSIEIIEIKSDRFPPYGVTDDSGRSLARLTTTSLDDLKVFSSQQQGLYLRGIDGSAEDPSKATAKFLQASTIDDGFWVLDSLGDEASKRSIRVHRGNERAIEQVVAGDFLVHGTAYRDYQYLGMDSLGELIIVDRGGRLLRLLDPKEEQGRGNVTGTWPPRKLSQVGGYQSMVDGAFIPVIQKYEHLTVDQGVDDPKIKRGCVSAVGLGDTTELSFDYWVCYPRGGELRDLRSDNQEVPEGTILIESISGPSTWFGAQVSSRSTVTIETRLLVLSDHQWYAFSYLWDQEQSDAVLVENQEWIDLKGDNAGSMATWVTTRSESCYECHDRGPLGFRFGGTRQEQLRDNDLLLSKPIWGQISDTGGELVKEQRIRWAPMLVRSDALRSQEYMDKGFSGVELDWGWFKESLEKDHIELWYRNVPRPDGFFPTEFDSNWDYVPNGSTSLVTQSSFVLDMAKAYLVFEDAKYLDAVRRGTAFLRERFRDPSHGGYYFRVHEQGRVMDRSKDGYGHACAIHALAAATNATGDQQYAAVAMECWRVVRRQMMQSGGGLVSRASEDFSGAQACLFGANVKLLEGLLELYRATRDNQIHADILKLLEYCNGQVPDQIGAIPEDGSRNTDFGHQVQLAYLLSLAVQEGFPRKYLSVGGKFMDYAIEFRHPSSGEGLPDASESSEVGFSEFEFLRALLRYYAMHGHQEYLELILAIQKNVQNTTIGSGETRWSHMIDGRKRNYTRDVSCGVAMCIEGIAVGRLVERTVQGLVKVK